MNPVPAVLEPDFTAEAKLEGPVLHVVLRGNADLNVKAQLDAFLDSVHAEVQRTELHDVEVDVRKLEFMNSSCLKCLVGWISRVQEEPPSRQYRIGFKSSPALFWQRRSLQALACLASELVTVQS